MRPAKTWNNIVRLMAIIAVGVVLGNVIAGLPGVIIGASLAAIYGWHITFSQIKRTGINTQKKAIVLWVNASGVWKQTSLWEVSLLKKKCQLKKDAPKRQLQQAISHKTNCHTRNS